MAVEQAGRPPAGIRASPRRSPERRDRRRDRRQARPARPRSRGVRAVLVDLRRRTATLAAVNDPIDTSSEVGMAVVRVLIALRPARGRNDPEPSDPFAGRRASPERRADRLRWAPAVWLPGRSHRNIRPEEANLIRDAAKRIVAGRVRDQARSRVERGRRAGRRPTGSGLRRRSAASSQAPRVAGLLEHKGTVVGDAPWQPIVDRKTWEQVRAVLERRRGDQPRYGPRSHVLVGLVSLRFVRLPSSRRSRRGGDERR